MCAHPGARWRRGKIVHTFTTFVHTLATFVHTCAHNEAVCCNVLRARQDARTLPKIREMNSLIKIDDF